MKALFLSLVLHIPAWSQQLSDRQKHDIATDAIADVLFDGQSRAVRDRQRSFENVNGIKLQSTVEDASLDQLGGLSEHLFKLYKTISGPPNVQAKTITGEFSLLQDQTISNILTYRTKATGDLRSCVLPEADTAPLDSSYTSNLNNGAVTVADYNEAPAYIDETLLQASGNYDAILRKNGSCEDVFSSSTYDIHVKNTRQGRKNLWQDDATALKQKLYSQMGLLGSTFTASPSYNSGSTGLGSLPDLSQLTGSHVINCNNSVDMCTQRDMEMRCRILYKHTGIRYLFLTSDLDYFLPKDSIALFRDAAVSSFSAEATQSVVIALYLRMYDASEETYGTALLVKQVNGQWLSSADISFATYNNGGDYKGSTYYRFKNLYKNIPKPLVICYQVAKVSGLLTTAYLHKGAAVKGREQIFYHVFKLDAAFEEVAQYAQQIAALNQIAAGAGGSIPGSTGFGNNTSVLTEIAELRSRQKVAYLNAARNPRFNESEVHFKEVYLQDNNLMQAAALKEVQIKYGQLYNNNQFDDLIGNAAIPSDINEGSCATGDNSDAIGDVLNFSSLLLSPIGLDLIPDALAVAYYASTDQTLDMFMASASFFMPGSLSGAKAAVSGGADAITKINRGSRLIIEGGQVKAVNADINHLTTLFKISPEDVDVATVSKINGNPSISAQLAAGGATCSPCLPVSTAQAMVWQNTERLPAPKRLELLNKTLDDGQFRAKIYEDPDEILRWGGLIARGVKKEDFLKSVSEFQSNANLGEQAWEMFRNENWTGLENLVNSNGINGGWPPNGGFISGNSAELSVGTEIDRYGGSINGSEFSDNGRFVAAKGSAFESRALPHDYLSSKPYKKYKVVKKIVNVIQGPAIPWFGQVGNGIQFKLPGSINDLLADGYIEVIP